MAAAEAVAAQPCFNSRTASRNTAARVLQNGRDGAVATERAGGRVHGGARGGGMRPILHDGTGGAHGEGVRRKRARELERARRK